MASKYSSDPAQRARELHAEGRLGGKRYGKMGGRPRKAPASSHRRPAAAAVANAAAENADQIARVFVDALQSDELSDTQKVAAMKTFLGIEDRETVREHEEERNVQSRGEMEEELSRLLDNPQIRAGLTELLAATS